MPDSDDTPDDEYHDPFDEPAESVSTPRDEPDDEDLMPPADRPEPNGPAVAVAEPTDAARARVVLAIAAVVLLGAIGWFLFGRPAEVVAPPTTTTTTTTTTAPKVMGWPAGTAQIATVKPEIPVATVLSAAPPEWESAKPVARWEAPELPKSEDTMPPRDALPRIDYPIEGRRATATGWEFDNPTVFDNPLTFLVTEMRGDWAEVLIPVRPNSTHGWINLNDITLSDHDYRVELRLAEHRLTVYKGKEVIADTQVVTGKDATRTPTGRYYVSDKMPRENPDGFYGPFVLALDGYSEQLDIFDDGVPVIAMHGTNRPDLLGTSASNGCIRMPNDVITQLNAELPVGTPVEIYA